MKYSESTRRCFESAARAGALPGAFRGAAGDRAQGTWVQFDVKCDADSVTDARFLVFGCPHTIAAAAWLAQAVVGTAPRCGMPESVQALRERFEVPVEKLGRLLIVEDALKRALAAAIEKVNDA
jgi:NifU-like protein involved in Fe-S cluster formation